MILKFVIVIWMVLAGIEDYDMQVIPISWRMGFQKPDHFEEH